MIHQTRRRAVGFCRWVLCSASLLTLAACAQEPTLAERWAMDIDALQHELESRHIDLYHSISQTELTEQLEAIKRQLPDLTQPEIMVALMRTIQQVGDGHTQFSYWGAPHHRFPLRLQLFESELRVIGTDQNNPDLLGMRLHAVDDTPLPEVIERLKPVQMGVENAYSERHQLTSTLPVAEVLNGLGVTRSIQSAEFVFMDDEGKLHTRSLTSLPADKAPQAVTITLEPDLPEGFVPNRLSLDGLKLYLQPGQSTAYLRFDRYPTQRQMERFARGLKTEFSRQGIQRVIVDLRHNGGGDLFVGLTLAWGLILIDDLDWKNGIYVLTGPQTFSAAMSNSAQFRQLLNARLVGEPTGANPVGYQDADTFQLPHSGWTVMYSKRLYRFQETETEGVQPDVLIVPDWEQFKNGVDNQLQWVLQALQNGHIQ
ncbi:S41 family peptidase [Marinimicrobium sp. ABcell2]|uniref:S41 family peptidase n=1 Tax=Marinimicrobium sp. ABcell2 TaxID=3069751 RepID=UPI0027B22491|nr:S41 family peptidase [Marinimicrobium sp. ABcell2]MDQ2077752.1 S41 family peptidase [Marinimicrobium sp. ABcell2]